MARQPDPALLFEYERVLTALNQRAGEISVEPDLARIQRLLDLLGSPETAFRVIHVAGTNGKTSTSRMIAALLAETGLSVGLTTSPHLHDVRERISIYGEPIDLETFVEVYDDIAPFLEIVDAELGTPLTYFEVLTAMAFSAFANAPVDVAVVEVGMGGRWDSTNVVTADVSVITPIGMDHERFLGHTLEEIAGEKAGIIKPGSVVVCAEQQPSVMAVIEQRCAEVGAALLKAGSDFQVADRQIAVGGQSLVLKGIGGVYSEVFLPLHGRHQAANAATALTAVEAFFGAGVAGRRIESGIVESGFAAATSPGRLEVVKRNPTVLLDAAHNPHGATALASALLEEFDFDELIAVVGIFADKSVGEYLAVLEPVVQSLICTETNHPRALPAPELADEAARVGFGNVRVQPRLIDAIAEAVALADSAMEAGRAAGILVTGSVFTVAQARALLGRHQA